MGYRLDFLTEPCLVDGLRVLRGGMLDFLLESATCGILSNVTFLTLQSTREAAGPVTRNMSENGDGWNRNSQNHEARNG